MNIDYAKPIYVGRGKEEVENFLDLFKNPYKAIELLMEDVFEKFKLQEDDFAYYIDYIK